MEPLRNLKNKIKAGERRFTLNEAAAFTGLAIDDVRQALDHLMELYDCRIQVTENGDLIYDFGRQLHRRGAKSLKDIWNSALSFLWKTFTVVFKVWITITLVVYFVIFIILLIALVVASQSQQRGRGGRNLDLAKLFYIFASIFRWNTNSRTIIRDRDRRGYSYRKYKPTESILKPNKKNFIASVYDFVFGPKRVEADPLHNQKELASFIREENGILVHSEIEALTGLDAYASENLFTDLLFRFEGQANVSDNGTVYGRFENILRETGDTARQEIIYYWKEYEPEYELTGNSSTRNGIIGLMNGVNLFFSYLILSGTFSMAATSFEHVSFIHFILTKPVLFGWLPFIFSLLFFCIPLVRFFVIHKMNKQRRWNNIRKRFFKIIYKDQDRPLSLDEYEHYVNSGGSEEKLSKKTIKNVVEKLVRELRGEVKVDDEAKMIYHFPRIRRELQDVPQIRSRFRPDTDLGRVILDSD